MESAIPIIPNSPSPQPSRSWLRPFIISVCLNVLLLIGGGLLGNAYKNVVKKVEVKVVEKEVVRYVTKTVKVPVLVGGTVAMREETTTEAVTDRDTRTDAREFNQTITKRNLVTLGLGADQDLDPSGLGGATFLGSVGAYSEITLKTKPEFGVKSFHLWITAGL